MKIHRFFQKLLLGDTQTHTHREAGDFIGLVSFLERKLKNAGFKYRKNKTIRKFSMEREDIMAARIKFLKAVHNPRISGDKRPNRKPWVIQTQSKRTFDRTHQEREA
jgi:hypothetical protein